MRTHTGKTPYHPYKCNHCKNKCPSPSELKTHMMTHTDEKPYQCNHCGKAFTVNKSLINHLRIHLGKKKLYQCSHCDRTFSKFIILENI